MSFATWTMERDGFSNRFSDPHAFAASISGFSAFDSFDDLFNFNWLDQPPKSNRLDWHKPSQSKRPTAFSESCFMFRFDGIVGLGGTYEYVLLDPTLPQNLRQALALKVHRLGAEALEDMVYRVTVHGGAFDKNLHWLTMPNPLTGKRETFDESAFEDLSNELFNTIQQHGKAENYLHTDVPIGYVAASLLLTHLFHKHPGITFDLVAHFITKTASFPRTHAALTRLAELDEDFSGMPYEILDALCLDVEVQS